MTTIFLKKSYPSDRGYTLLFAILVASLVLAVGISILNINKKEVLLTASARDSSAAFYAADSGLECALYADRPDSSGDSFSVSTDNTANLASSCALTLLFPTGGKPSLPADIENAPVTFTFHVKFGTSLNGSCAIVNVIKKTDANGNPQTVIVSRGYNTGWSAAAGNTGCILPGAKRVERAIRYTY